MIQGVTIFNTISSIALFLGFSLGIVLLFKQAPKQRANLFLGIITIYIASYFVAGHIWGARLLEYAPHTVQLGVYFVMGLGPMMYLYGRASTEKDFSMQPRDWLHFIPLLLDLLYSYPSITASGSEKIAILEKFIKEGSYSVSVVHSAAKAVHLATYYFLTLRLVHLYRRHLNNTVSYIDNIYHRWLIFFSSILLLPVLGLILTGFTGYKLISLLMFISGVVAVPLSIYFAMLITPAIFSRFPHQIEVEADHNTDLEQEKYEHSRLAEEQKEAFLERLQTYMQHHQPYRESELTIGQLAERLNIPSNYLSQIINQELSLNFIDYINQKRVEAAKILLASDKYAHYTITAIAGEAGFNSKSAFYVAFKKYEGETPGQYRKSLKTSSL